MVLRYLRACAVGVELHVPVHSATLCLPRAMKEEEEEKRKEREKKMQEQQYKITNIEVKKKRDD